jgi:hypothetical protein
MRSPPQTMVCESQPALGVKCIATSKKSPGLSRGTLKRSIVVRSALVLTALTTLLTPLLTATALSAALLSALASWLLLLLAGLLLAALTALLRALVWI